MQQGTVGGPEIWLRGPVSPAAGAMPGAEPGPGYGLAAGSRSGPGSGPVPGQPDSPQGGFSWMSAHGGAGTSTLAKVVGGHDCGPSWPDVAAGEPGNVLLVARTHAAGLQAASRVLDMIRQGDQPSGVTVTRVVLVADAPGRLPRELTERIKVIGSVIEIHRVPWVPAWRTGDLSGPAPREVTALSLLTGGNGTSRQEA